MKHHYIIFLRGVNVGGRATVKMDLLKELLGRKGFEGVSSYINSGNIALQSDLDKPVIQKIFKDILRDQFGIAADLLVKTREEVKEIISKNPFNEETENDNAKRVVVMLSGIVDSKRWNSLKENKSIVENFYPADDLIYIYYNNGIGRSKFTNTLIEKKLGVIATARNWNTILKMSDE
jgi:uncharacterized protein (DUF1697 family)